MFDLPTELCEREVPFRVGVIGAGETVAFEHIDLADSFLRHFRAIGAETEG